MNRHIVDVLIPVAIDTAYSYRVPAGMEVAAGDIVEVPLGPRDTIGVVWGDGAARPGLDNKLRDISAKLDFPPLAPDLRRFIDWVGHYTLCPRGQVLRMALRMGDDAGPGRLRIGVRLAGPPPQRMTPARQRVLALLADGFARLKSEAAEEAGVSVGVIDGLVDEGTLEAMALAPPPVAKEPDPDFAPPDLSPQQREAADALVGAIGGGFSVALLDGVTGSGKTAVYFEAVAETLRQGKQVLILMPEIALTAQFLDRFAERFGERPAEWHSDLTQRKRARTFAAITEGSVRAIAGARSALFLPYADLGLIIVDEEHDIAYKQEDGARYHARDMAIVRAREAKIPIVLASATPSIETEVNARRGRYRRLALPVRFGGQDLPKIDTIDLRREGAPRGRFIAPRLAEAIGGAMTRGEQALLFLNRRGYAPLTLCRVCGYRVHCPNCDAWLVEHRFKRRLVCHHCGFAAPLPPACPECLATESFVPVGPGVERLEEEVHALFPDARVMVLSSDLVATLERLREELGEIESGRVDVIIGTQLVAKGHHFPALNLVGVIDADLGLGNGDPRAAERTFQVLHQVIGRAGRSAGASYGFLQTHQPEHPVIAALVAGDRDAFYDTEIELRERTGYPPFGRLAALVVSGADKIDTEAFARRLAAAAPRNDAVRVLGPAEAPLAVLRGRYRFRLLAKSARGFDLSAYMRDWLAGADRPRGSLKIEVDIDPQSFS